MDLSTIALQGLQQADVQLDQAASRIASWETGSSGGANSDTVTLSAEMVAVLSAQTQSAADINTLKTADVMQKNLIDMMA